jgi:glycosyltransferase involved in cell wall biosynthesis
LEAASFGMTLGSLPPAPGDKMAWPWLDHDEGPPLFSGPAFSLPKITLITPSFNQAAYLEETIRSVILQRYPNLEYIIVDGGSDDGSVDIIEKYSPWISWWISEPDNGQSDAINRGYHRSTGEIVGWLCSDDLLRPDALWKVAFEFMRCPHADVLAGACRLQYDCDGGRVCDSAVAGLEWETHPYSDGIWQPSCFFRKTAVGRDHLVEEGLHYCMDRELWCHFVKSQRVWRRSDEVLSHYRYTGHNKSVMGNSSIINELVMIFNRQAPTCIFLAEILRDIWLPLVLRGMKNDSGPKRIASSIGARVLAFGLLILYPRRHVRNLQREIYAYSVW